ncbi:hypothetical protein E4U46_002397, partial [Claviceps purpurea]
PCPSKAVRVIPSKAYSMNGGGGIGPPTQTVSGTVEHGVIFGARVGLEAQFLVLARAYMSSQDTAAYGTDVGCGTDVAMAAH